MSNLKAEDGILELLDKFDDDELCSLAVTVTQGLLRNKVSSREEAIEAILKYSKDYVSIVRRKIVTREILFDYLHEKNVPITLPITKNELIDKVLIHWNTQQNGPQKHETTEVAHESTAANSSDDTVNLLAEQFTKWFYEIMNQDEIIGTEHFFPDAKLKLNMYANDQCISDCVEDNPEEIVNILFQRKKTHNLFFNPNFSKEGIQGRMDPHGLVIVLACGTLHVNANCAGIFEQMFALARDPFSENNWKIKSTELNLRSKSGVLSVPTLCDSELTSNLLMLPSS